MVSSVKKYIVAIYAANGKVVMTKTLIANTTTNQQQIDVSNLPAGMYLVQISNANGSYSKKIFFE